MKAVSKQPQPILQALRGKEMMLRDMLFKEVCVCVCERERERERERVCVRAFVGSRHALYF